MNNIELNLLNIIKKSLFDNECIISNLESLNDWMTLHRIALHQKLWPLVFEEICDMPEYLSLPEDIQNIWMNEVFTIVSQQVRQGEELSNVCDEFNKAGIKYVILKGISCRRYYPNPDHRPSGDEDILIDWRDYQRCDELLKSLGYECEDNYEYDDVFDKREAHYRSKDGLLYLEVHFNAIGKENKRQQRLNDPFDDVFNHTVVVNYEGHDLVVLEPTYQIMHLLSHFYRHLFDLVWVLDK